MVSPRPIPDTLTNEIEEKFWQKVDKSGTGSSECWLWLGSRNNCGYGQVRHHGRLFLAHRLSLYFYLRSVGGVWDDHLLVCHGSLNNPCISKLCVRPSHLRLGTYLDNNHDVSSYEWSCINKYSASKKSKEEWSEINTKIMRSIPVEKRQKIAFDRASKINRTFDSYSKSSQKGWRNRKQREFLSIIGKSEADEIRELYSSGEWTQPMLSKEYGISQSSVSRIIHNKVWT